MLKVVLNDAVQDAVISKSPADGIKALKETDTKAAETYHRALTEQEQKDFMQEMTKDSKTATFNEDGTATIGSLKSEAGKRDIPLNDTIKDILPRQRKKQGSIVQIENRVFTAVYGGIVHNHTINRAISDALARLEEQGRPIRHFTAHALRDTFATRYIEQGGNPQINAVNTVDVIQSL